MLPYLFSPDTASCVSGLLSLTVTCSRSSSVILIGLSFWLGIVPLASLVGRMRGVRRGFGGRRAGRRRRIVRNYPGRNIDERLTRLRIDRNHQNSRKDIPGNEQSEGDSQQMREQHHYPMQRRFLCHLKLSRQIGQRFVVILCRRFHCAMMFAALLATARVGNADQAQALDTLIGPAEKAFFVTVRVV